MRQEVRDARAKCTSRKHAESATAFDPQSKFIMPRFARTPSRLVNRGDEARDQQLTAYKTRRDLQIVQAKKKLLSQSRARSASRSRRIAARNGEVAAKFTRESPTRNGVQAWSSPCIVGPRVTKVVRSDSPKDEAPKNNANAKRGSKLTTKKNNAKTRTTRVSANGLPFWFEGQADAWELLNAPIQK